MPHMVGYITIGIIVIVERDHFIHWVNFVSELAGDDHLVATPYNCSPQYALAVPAAVVGGSIKKIGSQVNGFVDGADRLVIINHAPNRLTGGELPNASDRPTAHADGGYFYIAASKDSFQT